MLPELILYYREGCHLCEDMQQLLGELLEPGTFRLTRVDIDEDASLREIYNVLVPVLTLVPLTGMNGSTDDDTPAQQPVRRLCDYPLHNEIVLCEHFLDLEAVRGALASYNKQLLVACSSPAK